MSIFDQWKQKSEHGTSQMHQQQTARNARNSYNVRVTIPIETVQIRQNCQIPDNNDYIIYLRNGAPEMECSVEFRYNRTIIKFLKVCASLPPIRQVTWNPLLRLWIVQKDVVLRMIQHSRISKSESISADDSMLQFTKYNFPHLNFIFQWQTKEFVSDALHSKKSLHNLHNSQFSMNISGQAVVSQSVQSYPSSLQTDNPSSCNITEQTTETKPLPGSSEYNTTTTDALQFADLDTPLMNGWRLFPYQKEAAATLIQRRHGILAFDMGLGKTLVCLVVARTFRRAYATHTVVIAPKSVLENWKREADIVGEFVVQTNRNNKQVCMTGKEIDSNEHKTNIANESTTTRNDSKSSDDELSPQATDKAGSEDDASSLQDTYKTGSEDDDRSSPQDTDNSFSEDDEESSQDITQSCQRKRLKRHKYKISHKQVTYQTNNIHNPYTSCSSRAVSGEPDNVLHTCIEFHSWAIPPSPCDVITRAKANNHLNNGQYILIADEAHYMQNIRAYRTKAVLKLARHPKCLGVILATGTPMKNGRPAHLFPLLCAIKHPLSRNLEEYRKRFCGGQLLPTGTGYDEHGASNLDELKLHTAKAIIYKTKSECLEIPGLIRKYYTVDISESDHQAFKTEVKNIRAAMRESRQRMSQKRKITDHVTGSILQTDAVGALQSLRKCSSIVKVPGVCTLAKQLLDASYDTSIVVFAWFKDTAKQIFEDLIQYKAELLTGEDRKHRQAKVDRFQCGQSRVFIATFGAGGVGITLTQGSHVILVDRPWTPGDVLQAEDRLRRIGQQKEVYSYWIRATELDEFIDQILVAKNSKILQLFAREHKSPGAKLRPNYEKKSLKVKSQNEATLNTSMARKILHEFLTPKNSTSVAAQRTDLFTKTSVSSSNSSTCTTYGKSAMGCQSILAYCKPQQQNLTSYMSSRNESTPTNLPHSDDTEKCNTMQSDTSYVRVSTEANNDKLKATSSSDVIDLTDDAYLRNNRNNLL